MQRALVTLRLQVLLARMDASDVAVRDGCQVEIVDSDMRRGRRLVRQGLRDEHEPYGTGLRCPAAAEELLFVTVEGGEARGRDVGLEEGDRFLRV